MDCVENRHVNNPLTLFCITFIVLGVVLRFTNMFVADISFWTDEAAVALNLHEKSFAALFHPLDYGQVAPIGFCLLTKAATLLLGNNEIAFRLIPFLGSLGAIGLVFLFVRKTIGALPALLCAAQLAVAKEPVYFSTSLKPYVSDTAIALGLMMLAWNDKGIDYSWKRLAVIGLAGAVCVWFSFPAIFILGAIGALWTLGLLKNFDKKRCCAFAAIIVVWLLSFWVHFHFLQTQTGNNYLLDFWHDNFMPFPPTSLQDLGFFAKLPNVFRNPLWTSHPYISVCLFAAGCVILFSRNKRLLLFILVPLFLNLVASGLHKYPFGDRMLQYGVMHLFIPIALCLSILVCRNSGRKWVRVVAVLLICANLIEPGVNAVKGIFIPQKREQVKDVARFLADHPQGHLPYYILGSSQFTYAYYIDRYNLRPESIEIGLGVRESKPGPVAAKTASFKGKLWLLFGHGQRHKGVDVEAVYLTAAGKRGVLLDKVVEPGAAAYLFQFPR